MALIIVIFLVGGFLLEAIFRMIGDTAKASKVIYQESKEKHRIRKINDPEIGKKLWKHRVMELNLVFENAIYVLTYFDSDCNAGLYRYLWYEDGALAFFSTPKLYGDVTLTISPEEWKVQYIEITTIEGFHKRREYCQLNINDGSKLYFSLDNYRDIVQLFRSNGLA